MFHNVNAKLLIGYIITLCALCFSEVILTHRRHYSESYEKTRLKSLCGINSFQCDSGECISEEKLCDGKEECSDGSDETRNCVNILPCASNFLFQCDYGACINKSMACDGTKDCKDNSDETEAACKNRCGKAKFQCNSGNCIDEDLVCDGIRDCSDYTDETSDVCSDVLCPPYMYRCKYGACAPRGARCNGIRDCIDGSDEAGCNGPPPTSQPPATQQTPTAIVPTRPSGSSSCGQKKFRCNSGECIDKHRSCDGWLDCRDNSDENANLCSRIVCPSYAFRCDYGGCIAGNFRCNGYRDCYDNSDEMYCSSNSSEPILPPAPTRPPAAGNVPPTSSTSIGGCKFPDHPPHGAYSIGGALINYTPGQTTPQYSVLITSCNQGYNTSPPDENLSICVNSAWTPAPALCARMCPTISPSQIVMVECKFNKRVLKSCDNAVEGTTGVIPCDPIDVRSASVVQSLVSVCKDGRWELPASQCISNQAIYNNSAINVFYIFNGSSTNANG